MMKRKKHAGGNNGNASHTHGHHCDDGGAAKEKPLHLLVAPRLQAAFGPSSASASLKRSLPRRKSDSPAGYCLPGVPMVLKLVLISFVGFAVLVVMTAKGRHAHWRYQNQSGMRGAHMPEPLLNTVKRQRERNKVGGAASVDHGDKTTSYLDATHRMLAQPSRFVDSEKKLKQQLRQLLEKQEAEKRKKPADPNNSVLGIKISNRYLGEDLLPYPESKGGEKDWEKKMKKRKLELSRTDEQEWTEIMRQYKVDIHDDADPPGISAEEDSVKQIHSLIDSMKQRLDDKGIQMPKRSMGVVPPKGSEQWPSPTAMAGTDAIISLKPAFGSHRPSEDAILVFAEGYDLSIYLAFVESLVQTGYKGDLVFSISTEEKLKPGVKEYLQSKNSVDGGVNIVAYEVNWSCFKQSGEPASGSNEGINHCKMNNAYGDASGNPIPDPRAPRPVATARYELYWIWSLQYIKESWMMLIDARDVWFQLHPFHELAARGKVSGELHFFGENADAVKIGTSRYNRGWLITAYGQRVASRYFDKPVICSGSTIGNQDAIETYLRAMVSEYDTSLCKSKGCDQGFHNYLYYSGKLKVPVEGISKVIVHEQGKGIINNLGALRTKPLKEWGLYNPNKQIVLNWDGTTSAVAHQYDRDKEVNAMVKARKRQFAMGTKR